MVTHGREDTVFKAVADPTRRAILEALRGGPLPVQAISGQFPGMSRPAISKHLKILREAGLVAEEQQGRKRFYDLRGERFPVLEAWVSRFQSVGSRRSARQEPPGSRAKTTPRPQPRSADWRVW